MQCYRAESSLDEAIQPLKEYLILKYGPEMSFVRTKDERSKLVDMALRPLLIFTSKVRIVRELANMVVSDIDKASFSLQRQIDIYKLTNKPERTI